MMITMVVIVMMVMMVMVMVMVMLTARNRFPNSIYPNSRSTAQAAAY